MGPQLALQLLDGQGAVLRQAVESAALRAEQGVVHLAAAGVHHGAENGVLVGDAAVGNGLQCGNPHAGDIFRQGNSLYTGDANAHPRKGARPMETAMASSSPQERPTVCSRPSTMGSSVWLWTCLVLQ